MRKLFNKQNNSCINRFYLELVYTEKLFECKKKMSPRQLLKWNEDERRYLLDMNVTMMDKGAGSGGSNGNNNDQLYVIFGVAVVSIIILLMCMAWLYKICVKDKEELEKLEMQQAASNHEENNERNIHKRQGSAEALEHYRKVTSMKKIDVKDLENDSAPPKIGRPTTEEESDEELEEELEEKTNQGLDPRVSTRL